MLDADLKRTSGFSDNTTRIWASTSSNFGRYLIRCPLVVRAFELRRLVTSAAHSGSGTILLRFCIEGSAIAGGIAIARALGPEGKGYYAFALSLVALAACVGDGAGAAASWQWRLRCVAPQHVYESAVASIAILSFLFCVPLIVISFTVHTIVLLAVAAALPPTLFFRVANGLLLPHERLAAVNLQFLLSRLGPSMSAGIVFFVPGRLNWVLLIWVASQYAAAACTARSMSSIVMLARVCPQRAVFCEYAGFAMRSCAVRVMDVLNGRVDLYLVLWYLGASALGVYSVAVGMGELLWQVSRNFAVATYGRIARSTLTDATAITLSLIVRTCTVTMVAAALAFVLAPQLIVTLYGSSF